MHYAHVQPCVDGTPEGDHLPSLTSINIVRSVDHTILEIEAIQIELQHESDAMFVGMAGVDAETCVEVFGEAPPASTRSGLKVLSFKRFDNFRTALLESPELEPCRLRMAAVGVCADLSEHGLGPGKLFVAAEHARPVVQALIDRGEVLRSSNVIVSREYELLVLDLVQHYAPRALAREPAASTLELPRPWRTRISRTFLHVDAPLTSSASSAPQASSL